MLFQFVDSAYCLTTLIHDAWYQAFTSGSATPETLQRPGGFLLATNGGVEWQFLGLNSFLNLIHVWLRNLTCISGFAISWVEWGALVYSLIQCQGLPPKVKCGGIVLLFLSIFLFVWIMMLRLR